MQSAVTKPLYNSDDVVEWAIQEGVVTLLIGKNKKTKNYYTCSQSASIMDHGVMVFYDYIRSIVSS